MTSGRSKRKAEPRLTRKVNRINTKTNPIKSDKRTIRKNPRIHTKRNSKRRVFMPKARLKLKRANIVLALFLCLFFGFIANRNDIFAYFTDIMSITNIFTINAEYTVTFNANSGTGTMNPQSISYNVATALTTNGYTKTGYSFAGWNTLADGNGTAYTNGEEVTNIGNTTLYAQWEKAPTKYAVQIYGINQDEDEDGNPIGLTFGPAVGSNYNNSYVTHTYEETSEGSGQYYVKIVTHTVAANNTETTSAEYLYEDGGTTNKVIRTEIEKNKYDVNIHNMTWTQIANTTDKTVFLDCMLCGDTKRVELELNNTIGTGSLFSQYGDGAGTLSNSINPYYRMWNPAYNNANSSYNNLAVGTGVTLDSNEQKYGSNAKNAGGYSTSHIRATLVGKDSKTNEGYAGDVNLSTSDSLYSCIESDLQNVITAKKVKYVTGANHNNYSLNDDISDKIWLFSNRELYGTGQYTGNTTEGIGTSGDGYDKFGNNESKYYISSYNNSATDLRKGYTEDGSTTSEWLRSPDLLSTHNVRYISITGSLIQQRQCVWHLWPSFRLLPTRRIPSNL